MAGNSQRRARSAAPVPARRARWSAPAGRPGAALRARARHRRPRPARGTRRRAGPPRRRRGVTGGRASGERPGCWSAATRSSRRCGQGPGHRAVRRDRLDTDERVTESVRRRRPRHRVLEVGRAELDRRTGGILHQGIALQVPPYRYARTATTCSRPRDRAAAPLLVALDGVTDPRNLGAVVRSAVAFGAHGVTCRSGDGRHHRDRVADLGGHGRAGAGRAGDEPGPRAQGVPRRPGCSWSGWTRMARRGDDLEVATIRIVVVGPRAAALSRLVGETCDLRVSIPMTGRPSR